MPKTNMTSTCLSPQCNEVSSARCLCVEHYKENRELVDSGKVSWNELFLIMGMEAAKLRQRDVVKP